MIIKLLFASSNLGFIAGSGDGIVSINGQGASRKILLLDANTLQILKWTVSDKNGHYMFVGLDATKQFMLLCRDYKKEYEPAAWDYVTPATDLTIAEQQELWQSWQTSP